MGAAIVVLVDGGPAMREVERVLIDHGHVVACVRDLAAAASLLRASGVLALVLDDRPLGHCDAVLLDECRRTAPDVAVVAVTRDAASSSLVRALETGATTSLAWPAPAEVLLDAIRRGGAA